MALSWPTARDLRDDVRLVRVRSRSEERGRRDHARSALASACLVTFLYVCVPAGSRVAVHCRASA